MEWPGLSFFDGSGEPLDELPVEDDEEQEEREGHPGGTGGQETEVEPVDVGEPGDFHRQGIELLRTKDHGRPHILVPDAHRAEQGRGPQEGLESGRPIRQ